MSENAKSALTIVGMLVAMVAILFAAYYTTRLVGGRYGRTTRPGGGVLKVVERIPLGRNECLCVVNTGEKTLLVGVTQSSVSMLCELPDYPLPTGADGEGTPGTSFYRSFMDELKKKTGFAGKGSQTDIGKSDKYDE